MHEMDNNENPIIQSLEALLGGEEQAEVPLQNSFEEMRSKFKESFSLDVSKDSGIAYPNLSFANRHMQNMDTSMGNQSIESGFASESFDGPFHFKPLVKNVSFDGCFVEDDSTASQFMDMELQCKPDPWHAAGAHSFGILSSAISQGGDLGTKHLCTTSTQEAYGLVKYAYMLNQCWDSVSCISKLRCQLSQKPLDSAYVEELKLSSLIDALKSEITKVARDVKSPRPSPIIVDIQNTLDLMISNDRKAVGDRKFLKQLRSLIGSLFVMLYSELALQNSSSSPLEDQFRSEKRFQIWNSLA